MRPLPALFKGLLPTAREADTAKHLLRRIAHELVLQDRMSLSDDAPVVDADLLLLRWMEVWGRWDEDWGDDGGATGASARRPPLSSGYQ